MFTPQSSQNLVVKKASKLLNLSDYLFYMSIKSYKAKHSNQQDKIKSAESYYKSFKNIFIKRFETFQEQMLTQIETNNIDYAYFVFIGTMINEIKTQIDNDQGPRERYAFCTYLLFCCIKLISLRFIFPSSCNDLPPLSKTGEDFDKLFDEYTACYQNGKKFEFQKMYATINLLMQEEIKKLYQKPQLSSLNRLFLGIALCAQKKDYVDNRLLTDFETHYNSIVNNYSDCITSTQKRFLLEIKPDALTENDSAQQNAFAQQFNNLSLVVSYNIISIRNKVIRNAAITFYTDVADTLYKNRNFQGMMAVLSGILIPAICQLQSVAEALDCPQSDFTNLTKTQQKLRKLADLSINLQPESQKAEQEKKSFIPFFPDVCAKVSRFQEMQAFSDKNNQAFLIKIRTQFSRTLWQDREQSENERTQHQAEELHQATEQQAKRILEITGCSEDNIGEYFFNISKTIEQKKVNPTPHTMKK